MHIINNMPWHLLLGTNLHLYVIIIQTIFGGLIMSSRSHNVRLFVQQKFF